MRQPIELFRGTLTDAAFQATEANLTKSIRARSNAKPHIAGLMPASTLAIEPVPPTGVPGGTSNCLLRLSIVRKEEAIIGTDRNFILLV